jgi:L-seryl-tRNA(Ser) seleniumtransferase
VPDEARTRARLRGLPAVDSVVDALGDVTHRRAVHAARRAVDEARALVRAGLEPPTLEDIVSHARALLKQQKTKLLQPVLNATGVLLHTNLGRAPLGEAQLDAVTRIARGYSNLEYDLSSGTRGNRYDHARAMLASLTGAEAAIVVNNNAGAVLLCLTALCRGREVVISRGELIEIGGEFRIPEVMNLSGARLVEVGTTNRTHLGDYEHAITPETAAILKVHPSNYRVVGFTKSVASKDVARLARGRGVLFVHDVGSGLLGAPAAIPSAAGEPPVDVALSEGADLVTFSGDKLFGGPQAGVVVGRSELVGRLATHPLARALRVDKMTLAALEATARILLEDSADQLPLWRMAWASLEELERRAQEHAARLDEALAESGVKAEAVASRAVTGGGSLPESDMSSWAIALGHSTRSVAEMARALRSGVPPVIGRVEGDRLLIDLRTIAPDDDAALSDALLAALV